MVNREFRHSHRSGPTSQCSTAQKLKSETEDCGFGLEATRKQPPPSSIMSTLPSLLPLSLVLLSGCWLEKAVINMLAVPKFPFEEASLPEEPDYSQDRFWAALPGAADKSDLLPPGETDQGEMAAAFFIHPSTLLSKKHWVQDTQKPGAARELLDEFVLSGMASIFNGCCEVYAPRYRQATFGAYYVPLETADAVFQIAYADIDRAFTQFLERKGEKPFVLAAHSQGSLHAQRLLERIDASPELRKQLVATYVPGHKLPLSTFGSRFVHLVPCAAETQTGCIASWNTYATDADPYAKDIPLGWSGGRLKLNTPSPIACTNPVTGRSGTEPSELERHWGAVPSVNTGEPLKAGAVLKDEPMGTNVTRLGDMYGGLVSAVCDEQGFLRIGDLNEPYEPVKDVEAGEYHEFDFELFYMDVRMNAKLRTENWLAQQQEQAGKYVTCQAHDDCGTGMFCGVECWTGACGADGAVPESRRGRFCQPCAECEMEEDAVDGSCAVCQED
jgi:hypothetical protein